MRQIIKQINNAVLFKRTELAYFKNGRANMHTKISYYIEVNGEFVGTWHTNKATALKHLKAVAYSE